MNYNQQIETLQSKLQSLWNKTDEVQKEVEICLADLVKLKAAEAVDDLAKAIETAQAKCKTTLPIDSSEHEWFHCKNKMPQKGDYIVVLNDIEGKDRHGKFFAGMCTYVDLKVNDEYPIEISDVCVFGHIWRYCTPQELPSV